MKETIILLSIAMLFFNCTSSSSDKEKELLERENAVLKKEMGKLQDIRGFTLYSWKDTGCTDAAEFLTPFDLRDQLRHSTMEMVMKYYHKKTVIQAVKKHPVQL